MLDFDDSYKKFEQARTDKKTDGREARFQMYRMMASASTGLFIFLFTFSLVLLPITILIEVLKSIYWSVEDIFLIIATRWKKEPYLEKVKEQFKLD